MTPDDTQDATSEPGNPDINLDATGLPGTRSPYPPSGICLAGDGLSECLSTPPNSGLDNVAWQRIVGICQLLQRNQTIIWRIE